MKTRLIQTIACAACLVMTASAAYPATPAHNWSHRYGDTSPDRAQCVAVDPSGNTLIIGQFQGPVDFGGGNLSTGIFLAKYDASGAHLWSKNFPDNTLGFGYSVATDASGNVVITGTFSAPVNFGGGTLFGAGGTDIFVAKYNAAGTHQWSHDFGDGGTAVAYSISVGAGSVIVTGSFQGLATFGGGALVSAGATDMFVARYTTSSGTHVWSQRFGGTGADEGRCVVTDASSNVYVTGSFAGTVNFGGANLVSAGGTDIVVAKYNSTGVHQWSQRFGDTGADEGRSVALDAVYTGNVFATGSFSGTVNFGGGALVSAGTTDIFLAAFNAAGVYQSSGRFGGITADVGNSLQLSVGSVFVAGSFRDAVDFGGGNLVSAGQEDIFVARFNSLPAAASILSILDIGNDQGRLVKIRFERSGYDQFPLTTPPIIRYEAYRRDDAPPGAAAMARDPAGASDHELRAGGWTQVGSVAAHLEASYGINVPTIGDSTIALGQYRSVFYIRAATTVPGTFFDSPPDSGYSRDNLPPGVASNFAYAASNLSWDESTAADFDYFTVYGSNTDSFGAATVVDYSVAPAMNVAASPYVYYYVTATDFSGNEGKPAKINTLSGVGGTPKNYVLSVSNYPNPFNPRTTVRYNVPSRGPVTISIYDANGARVATLFKGERNAGAYSVDWDGRTEDAAVAASGVYFARIEHSSGTRTKKMVLLK